VNTVNTTTSEGHTNRGDGQRWSAMAPIAVALAVAAAVMAWHYARILLQCEGQFVYGLDDAYIHMSLARTLLEEGTWGINPGEFVGVSSSLLWPLLLAAVGAIAGTHDVTPMVINGVLVVLILLRVDRLLAARRDLPATARALLLVALFLCTPLSSLVFNGMEHLLHILLTVELLFRAGRMLAGTRDAASPATRDVLLLAVVAMLSTAVRYEALFQVGVLAVLLLAHRSWRAAGAVALAGLAPVLLYGGWLSAHGWPFLPTGLMLKTVAIESSTVEALRRTFNEFSGKVPGAMVIVLFISYALLRFSLRKPSAPRSVRADEYAALVFALSALIHLVLAHLGNLFRYEAYLYAGGAFALAALAYQTLIAGWRRWREGSGSQLRLALAAVALGLALFPFAQRGLSSLLAVPLASRDIYNQQVQMARFLQEHYPGGTVAINDIGAISYYTDLKIVDIWGLATREVAQLKRVTHFPGEDLDPVVQELGAQIALVYDPWVGEVPEAWTKVGEWAVEEKIVLGWYAVSFYALQPGAVAPLAHAFDDYEGQLPEGVESKTAAELD